MSQIAVNPAAQVTVEGVGIRAKKFTNSPAGSTASPTNVGPSDEIPLTELNDQPVTSSPASDNTEATDL